MKPELNETLKARFFAQYYGQFVGCDNETPEEHRITVNDRNIIDWLALRPISSITDEEAIEVAKASTNLMTDWNSSPNKKYFSVKRDGKYRGIEVTEKYSVRSVHIDPVDGEITVYEDEVELSATGTQIWGYQLMLSFGICLPFMGYSVEELVQAGWVKLREE